MYKTLFFYIVFVVSFLQTGDSAGSDPTLEKYASGNGFRKLVNR
jgi:hypothetical protein